VGGGEGGSGGIKERVVANYDDASFIFSPTMQNTCPKFYLGERGLKSYAF
jgi:hypothetical protein